MPCRSYLFHFNDPVFNGAQRVKPRPPDENREPELGQSGEVEKCLMSHLHLELAVHVLMSFSISISTAKASFPLFLKLLRQAIALATSPCLLLQHSPFAIMKFHTLALAAAALLAPKKVNSQTINGNFSLVASYEFPSALGAYLAGGSIVNDTLLLVVEAELPEAYLASVPVLRNCKLVPIVI